MNSPTAPSAASRQIVVTLDPWEYAHALDVGTRRFIANWNKGDAEHYIKERMEDDRTAQQAACVAELAVAKHTNRYWPGHVWHASEHSRYKDVADVGDNIEVRRVRDPRNGIAVRRHQLGKGLILWAAHPVPPEFRTVELYGWLPYDEAWDLGTYPNWDGGKQKTRTVPRHLFRTELPRLVVAEPTRIAPAAS